MALSFRNFTWSHPRLTKGKSSISGFGVFTSEKISKGEILMIFGGELVAEKDLHEEKYRLQTAFPITTDIYLVLPVSEKRESLDEYLNHSCNPTAWLIDEVTLVARRKIAKGEEITLDVATWDTNATWEYLNTASCTCKQKNCRKKIRPDDYLQPKIQHMYKGHFAPYVQQMINSGR